MISRAALAVFVTVVVEFLVFSYTARTIGTTPVVVLVIIAAAAGLMLLRREIPAVLRGGIGRLTASIGADEYRFGNHGLLVVAGLLLLVPGFLTGALGLLLLLPPIRALVRRLVAARFAHLVPPIIGVPFPADGHPNHHGNVVDVDVVTEDTPYSAPPELN